MIRPRQTLVFLILLLFTSLFLQAQSVGNTIDLSLEKALKLSGSNASKIKLKIRELKKAQLEYEKTKTKLYPKIDLQASSSYMTNPPEGITIHKGELGFAPSPNSQFPVPLPDRDYVLVEDTKHTYFKITTKLTQPIFTWNKIRNAIELASIEREIKEDELKKEKLNTLYNLKLAYYSGILARDSLSELREIKKTLIEINRDKEDSFKEGLITREELLKSRASLAATEMQIVEAEENYRTSIETIRLLTDIEEDAEVKLSSGFASARINMDEDELKSEALKNSPDLAVARKKVLEASRYLSVKKAEGILRPDFSLIVTLDITGQQIPIVGSNWTMDWDKNFIFSLGTSMKIFDMGESRLEARESEEDLKMAEQGLRDYRRLVSMNVRKAVQEAKVSYYTMLSKEAELEEAGEKLKNARVSYENELITREKYGLAEINFHSKKMEYLLSQFNYSKAVSDLERLTGMKLRKLQ